MREKANLKFTHPWIIFLMIIGAYANCKAQYAVSLSLETGTLHDRNHLLYQGQSISGGGFGGYAGFDVDVETERGYIFSSGFNRYRHSQRLFYLDRTQLVLRKNPNQAIAEDVVESYGVPLGISKKIQLNERWNLNLGLGAILIFARYPGSSVSVVSTPAQIDSSGANIPSPDSTRVDWGAKHNFNFAFETSLKLTYKTRSPWSFYANVGFQAHLKPVFEATFTFYADGATIGTGSSLALNSYSFGVGVAHTFRKRDKESIEKPSEL